MQQPPSSTPGRIEKSSEDFAGLPAPFVERLKSADVVILVSSSETGGLVMQPVIAGGMYAPETVKSHAYVEAIYQEHANLLRRVNGEPSDSQRYQAAREFTVLSGTDPERFERVNAMLMQFEEDNPTAGEHPTEKEADNMADFLVYALAETAPVIGTANPIPS